MTWSLAGFCFPLLALRTTEASAAEAAWKVGLAQVKITPDQPVPMSGYASRTKPFEKVAGDLFVKALVLEDETGECGVIVTSDILGFPAAVAEPICQAISKRTGLKRGQILFNSSHTHAGPLIDQSVPVAVGEEALRIHEYTRQLQKKTEDCVVQALANIACQAVVEQRRRELCHEPGKFTPKRRHPRRQSARSC